MNVDAIIEILGGSAEVQTLLGVGASAISNYRKRGHFPKSKHPRLLQALQAKGIDLTTLTGILTDVGAINARTGGATGIGATGFGAGTSADILLIITGGIAAYKSLELIRLYRGRGWSVRVVMTAGAQEFIRPLAAAALSGNAVYSDLFSLTDEAEMGHIRLAREANAVVVAPATANFMARTAQGFADDLASTILLATAAPILMAPAMNPFMWAHPATQANYRQLYQRGVAFALPESGAMACGEEGEGRLAELEKIVTATEQLLPGKGRLGGIKALITSGPTHEPIDAVRYIANRSSGKQGHAIARALARAGASVTLISGPVNEPPPHGVSTVAVETAKDMHLAALAALPADIAICAAAVGDFAIAESKKTKIKIKKRDTSAVGVSPTAPTLKLKTNPDILASIAQHKMRPKLVIGFAAETENLLEYAKEKRTRKGADWILANAVGAKDAPVFGSDYNKVHLITAEGLEDWAEASKMDVAEKLTTRIIEELCT